jgi:hypothetical protein
MNDAASTDRPSSPTTRTPAPEPAPELMFGCAWGVMSVVCVSLSVTTFVQGHDTATAFEALTLGIMAGLVAFFVVFDYYTPADSPWWRPTQYIASALASMASPDDAVWREEWPAVLQEESAWRRPGRVLGFAVAALRSRLGWYVDRFLASDAAVIRTTVVVTAVTTFISWRHAGTLEAFLTLVFTLSGMLATVDVLCRRRGIESSRRKRNGK